MKNELLINEHLHWATYIFKGGIVGLIVSLSILLLSTLVNGYLNDMTIGSCLAYSCTLTALLSQPIGLIGLLIGSSVGCLISYVVYIIHSIEDQQLW